MEFKTEKDVARLESLVCIDGSYIIYHTLFSAVNQWTEESPFSDILETVDVSAPDCERIDITLYADFIDILKAKLINTLYKIDSIVDSYNSMISSTTFGKKYFVLDPPHTPEKQSWRYSLYKDYKGTRGAIRDRKPFEVGKVFSKVVDMMTDDDNIANRFNIVVVSVDNAEGDDIISTIFMDDESSHFNKILIASDKDYLQMDDVAQFNLEGKKIEIEQPYPDLIKVTPDTYLLAKIITGDSSDNISQVFNRVGYKTAIKKYINNIEYLTECLECDKVAMSKFKMNTRLIDFKMIPKKIKESVRTKIASL